MLLTLHKFPALCKPFHLAFFGTARGSSIQHLHLARSLHGSTSKSRLTPIYEEQPKSTLMAGSKDPKPTTPPSSSSSSTWGDANMWYNTVSESPSTTLEQEKDQTEASTNQERGSSHAPPVSVTKPRRAACLACRHRKVRCSGCLPSCQRCRRLGHECVYGRSSHSAPRQTPQNLEYMTARLGKSNNKLLG